MNVWSEVKLVEFFLRSGEKRKGRVLIIRVLRLSLCVCLSSYVRVSRSVSVCLRLSLLLTIEKESSSKSLVFDSHFYNLYKGSHHLLTFVFVCKVVSDFAHVKEDNQDRACVCGVCVCVCVCVRLWVRAHTHNKVFIVAFCLTISIKTRPWISVII